MSAIQSEYPSRPGRNALVRLRCRATPFGQRLGQTHLGGPERRIQEYVAAQILATLKEYPLSTPFGNDTKPSIIHLIKYAIPVKVLCYNTFMKLFYNKFLPLFLLIFFASIFFYSDIYKKPSSGPDYNVVIFSFDGLQAKHLNKEGYPVKTTPNLDKFLDKSYFFKNTVSPAPWTVPSHISIFTSLFPSEHKVVNKFVSFNPNDTGAKSVKANLKELSPKVKTITEILKKNGYITGAFTGGAGVSASFGLGAGFDTYYDKDMFGGFDISSNKAEEWLSQNKDKKFFMFLHGYDVHGQHTPKDGYDYRYVKKPYKGKYTGSTIEQGKLREENLANGGLNLSKEDQDFWRAIYDEKINDADQSFGEFLEFLDKLDLTKKTIIITISDHGTEFFEHKGIDHGHTLYGELLDTLFAIHLPEQQDGKVVTDLVSTLDLTPTLLNILNLKDKISNDMKGVDLSPSFSDQDVSHDVFSETDYRLYTHKRSITTKDGWKFIITMENLNKELYNLNNDPNEQNNLVNVESKIAYELEQKVYNHLKVMRADQGPWIIGCLPVYNDQCQNLPSVSDTIEAQKKTLSSKIKPNIILINIDSLRADHMSLYGYGKNTTPFLDSFLKKGVVFNNAITPSILTFQTDAAIFSGLYPSQNNVQQWETPINPSLDLLPKVLGFYGYKSGAFVSPSLYEKFGWSTQFNYFKKNPDLKNINESKKYVASWMKDTKVPFFVFWHIYDVHSPFVDVSKEFYTKNYTGPFSNSKDSHWYAESQSKDEISKQDDIDFLVASYDSGIKYVDTQLKEFFESIQDEPWYSNSIFIISSEHGEDLEEHGFIFHRDVYDVNTRVPLVVVAPKLSAQKVNEAVSSLDIFPTIIDLIGGTVPVNIEGSSLLPLSNGSSLNRDIYTERSPFDEFSIRSKNWKYILRDPKIKEKTYFPFILRMITNEPKYTGDELYDLSVDPNEQNNLISKNLPIKKELQNKILRFQQKMLQARISNQTMTNPAVPINKSLIPYP